MQQHDLVVVGGGMAGVCAAIQGARLGLRTLLVERELVLGGCANSTFRLHLGGAHTGPHHNSYSRETGIIDFREFN